MEKMPLLLIGEVINKLKNTKYFNMLDLIWEYNNVQIKKDNEWKATFLTNKMSEDIDNTVSSDPLYRGLVTLLG